MTLLDMQRVFSRILTDRDFHRAFVAGDESVCAPYDLTERELRSLRGLRWDWVGLHVDLLAHSRLEMALKGLPLTELVLHKQLHGHLDRFCREFPPVPEANSQLYVEATRLCRFIRRLTAEGTLTPAWGGEVATYEHTALTLSISTDAAESSAAAADLNARWSGSTGDLDAVIPVAGPHVRVVTFGFPLLDLLSRLDDGEVPEQVAPAERPLTIMFHKLPGVYPTQTAKINAPTAALLDLCDGDRTLRAVLDVLVDRFGPRVELGALTAVDRFREAGVLGMRKEAGTCAA